MIKTKLKLILLFTFARDILIMKINKNIHINNNIDTSIQRICDYWENRGMKIVERSHSTSSQTKSQIYLKGKRGNLLGNLTSFKMENIISQIEIRKNLEYIECKLSIHTIFRYITNSNKKFFSLELETFEKYLLFNDLNKQAWKLLRIESKKEDTIFVTIFVMIGFFIGFFTFIILSVIF